MRFTILLIVLAVVLLYSGTSGASPSKYSPSLNFYQLGHPWNLTNGTNNTDAITHAQMVAGDQGQLNRTGYPLYYYNVKDYGALGDGSTNDTAAFIACFNAANNNGHATIYIPTSGTYNITPGKLPPILVNLYAPYATIRAHTSGAGALITLGNCSRRNIEINRLVGYYYNAYAVPVHTLTGTGLYMNGNIAWDTIKIKELIYLNTGLDVHGVPPKAIGFHIATNTIDVHMIKFAIYGVYIRSQDMQIEDNIFRIDYISQGNNSIYVASTTGTSPYVVDNTIDVQILEISSTALPATAVVVYTGANVFRNNMYIRSWLFTPADINKLIYLGSTCPSNYFEIPNLVNATKISRTVGTLNIIRDIGKGQYHEATNVGRSTTWGSAAPTTGVWEDGDICWNSAPASGGAPGWMCTTPGSPGTWKAMANLA
jgi:hypothetical protein